MKNGAISYLLGKYQRLCSKKMIQYGFFRNFLSPSFFLVDSRIERDFCVQKMLSRKFRMESICHWVKSDSFKVYLRVYFSFPVPTI